MTAPGTTVEVFLRLAARAECAALAATDPVEAAIDEKRAERFFNAAIRATEGNG